MNHLTNQYVMLHDEKRCIGCQACTVACKVLNDVPEGFSRVQVQIRAPEQASNALTIFNLSASPVSTVKMRHVSAFVLPERHIVMKTGSCRWINRAVLAAIIVLPRVLSMCAI